MRIHDFLTDQGAYVHTHYDEEWEDNGDGESGPMVTYSPAYDEYAGETCYFIAQGGQLVDCFPRDIAQEAAFDKFMEGEL